MKLGGVNYTPLNFQQLSGVNYTPLNSMKLSGVKYTPLNLWKLNGVNYTPPNFKIIWEKYLFSRITETIEKKPQKYNFFKEKNPREWKN